MDDAPSDAHDFMSLPTDIQVILLVGFIVFLILVVAFVPKNAR